MCLDVKDGNWTTRGYAKSLIANLWTRQLTDWTSVRLDSSQTSQVMV